MADEAKNKAAGPGKKFPKLIVVIVGITVVEAGVFFAAFKMAGSGPAPAHGEENHVIEGPVTDQPTGVGEVLILKSFRVPNEKSGRMYVYDLELSVVVPAHARERVEELVKSHAAEIGDCVARIIRGASDRVLREDDLRALREQFQEGIGKIIDDETVIQRVLIPRFVPMRTD